jgi:hypothetical protein
MVYAGASCAIVHRNEAVSVNMASTRLGRHYRELVTPEQAAKYWEIRAVMQTNLMALAA